MKRLWSISAVGAAFMMAGCQSLLDARLSPHSVYSRGWHSWRRAVTLPTKIDPFAQSGSRWHPGTGRRVNKSGPRPLQVLTTSDEVRHTDMDNCHVDARDALAPVPAAAAGKDGEVAEDVSPSSPKMLWWTKTRTEEDATINLAANAGFIAGVLAFAAITLFTVDMEISRGWTAGEVLLRVPIDNWLAYMSVLRDNPVLVKACTSGTVYALGDWTAQTFEGTALHDINRGRVVRSALAGLLLHGPLSHVWYDLCESAFDTIGWNQYWWVTGPKVIVDQILWGPFWNAVYICFLGVLKRDSVKTIWEAVTSTAIPLVIAGIRLWPVAHVVTYGLIPTENRLLWVDFVEIIWVTILSNQAADQARTGGEGEKIDFQRVEDAEVAMET